MPFDDTGNSRLVQTDEGLPGLDRLYIELASITEARAARELTVADALYRCAALLIEYQPLIASHCDIKSYEALHEALYDAQAAIAMIGHGNLELWCDQRLEPLSVPEH